MPFGAFKGDFGSADDVLRVLDETAAYLRKATNGRYNITTHNVFVVADLAGFRILQLLQKVCINPSGCQVVFMYVRCER
jgi:hypothetical protein